MALTIINAAWSFLVFLAMIFLKLCNFHTIRSRVQKPIRILAIASIWDRSQRRV